MTFRSSRKSLREAAARWVARPFFALLVVAARSLPFPVAARLSTGVSRAVYVLFPGVRAGLLANAARILGPGSSEAERAGLARGVLASFARFLTELVAPATKAPGRDILETAIGREHFEAAAARGKGIIAATLHMGNYEVAGMGIASLLPNVAVVYNRERVRFLERVRSGRRREARLDEIVIDDSRFFAIEVLRRLREGGIVLLAGDQVESRGGERFPFLHGEAPFPLWAARLSSSSGAPILPAFAVRDAAGRHQLRIEPPIFPDGREPRAVMEDLVRVFERYVRDHPEQWLMIRPFWVS
jgi:KDO2-lipid IV(A) lauroyltransferase